MRNESVKAIALGGVLAAVAVVVMCLGGMIALATYVCPMLCVILTFFVLHLCGKRIAWAWYGAVAIISLLLCPDKEAAAIYLVLGYYPIIKSGLDKSRLMLLWKLLIFNAAILLVYSVLLQFMGMSQLLQEFSQLGTVMLVVLLVMGNAVFFLLDVLLGRLAGKKFGR